MFEELTEGPCNWNVVSKKVMFYKFGIVGTAQVMEDLMVMVMILAFNPCMIESH